MSDQQQQLQQTHDAAPKEYHAEEMQGPTEDAAGTSSGDDEADDNNVKESQVAAVRRKTSVETTATYNTYDVLLGRGRAYQLYPGNRRFHAMINSNSEKYASSSIQSGKWKITMEIVDAVLAKGRFLKANKHHGWTVIPVEAARQKVAHALQYQNRRISNKERKNAAKARSLSPKDDVPPIEPADALQPVADLSDTEHDLSVYPNISRVYFYDSNSVQKDANSSFTSRSATEKFLHGMATKKAPTSQIGHNPSQASTECVAVPTTANHRHRMSALASIPQHEHDQTRRPDNGVVANEATNSAISNIDQNDLEGKRLSFSGFRKLPFYSATTAAAITAHDTGMPACEAKLDSTLPALTAATATRRMSNIEEVQQQCSREADTSCLDPLTVDTESTEVADFNHTFHDPHRQQLGSSPSYSWDHHFDEATQILVSLCAGTDSGETEQPSLAATWRGESKRHRSYEQPTTPIPYLPPPAPPPDAPLINNTRPSVFFPIEETNRTGNEHNLSSLDLYELLEEDVRREQYQHKYADSTEPKPPFPDSDR